MAGKKSADPPYSNYAYNDAFRTLESECIYILALYVNYDKKLKSINGSEEKTEELAKVYREILERLDQSFRNGELSIYSHDVIIDLTKMVTGRLASKHGNVRKKAGDRTP